MSEHTITNSDYAETLEQFAAIMRANDTLKQPMLGIFCDTKEDLVSAIKAIGGKWIKRMPLDDLNEYGTIRIESVDFAPLFLHIYRNKVCRKTVKWDCEPFLSPEDEQEVETAMGV